MSHHLFIFLSTDLSIYVILSYPNHLSYLSYQSIWPMQKQAPLQWQPGAENCLKAVEHALNTDRLCRQCANQLQQCACVVWEETHGLRLLRLQILMPCAKDRGPLEELIEAQQAESLCHAVP